MCISPTPSQFDRCRSGLNEHFQSRWEALKKGSTNIFQGTLVGYGNVDNHIFSAYWPARQIHSGCVSTDQDDWCSGSDWHNAIRHEDVLHNVGIAGRNFSEQHENLVMEMTRKFLEYGKAARLEAADPEIADWRQAESEPIEIRMTTDGFPIIPKLVMEKELKKSEWETLLRAFLTQHYCESTFPWNV